MQFLFTVKICQSLKHSNYFLWFSSFLKNKHQSNLWLWFKHVWGLIIKSYSFTHHSGEYFLKSLCCCNCFGLSTPKAIFKFIEWLTHRVWIRDICIVHKCNLPDSPSLKKKVPNIINYLNPEKRNPGYFQDWESWEE